MDSLHLWQSHRLHEAFSGRPRPMSSSPAGEQLGHCLRGMFFLPPPPSAGSQRGHMAPEHPCPCHPGPPFTPSTAGGIGLVPLSAAWPLSSSDHELPTASRASLGHYCVLDLAQCLAQGPLRRERVNGIWAFGPGGAAPPGAGFCVPCWGQIAASEFQPGVPRGGGAGSHPWPHPDRMLKKPPTEPQTTARGGPGSRLSCASPGDALHFVLGPGL